SSAKSLDLIEVLEADETWFRRRFRKTPFWRTRLRGMKRNAAIILANQQCAEAIAILERLGDDEDPMIANTATWAVEQILRSS
ncbi:MAG: epoxyqueuosine reductase, partial [Planctomycetota bacterium]